MGNLLEDKPAATLIGLAVILLMGLLLPNLGDLVELLESGDARVAAAVIGGLFGLFGIVISTVLNLTSSWFADRKTRAGIASALSAEAFAQASMVAEGAEVLAERRSQRKLIVRNDVIRFRPPPSTVYSALVDRVHFFRSEHTHSLIAFYGSLERLRNLIDELPYQQPSWNPSKGESPMELVVDSRRLLRLHNETAEAWKSAAYNGVAAIKSLEPYTAAMRSPKGKQKLDDLKERLAKIALEDLVLKSE